MKKIKLTQNKYTLVDDSDFKILNQYKWHLHFDRYNYYAIRNIPASQNNGIRSVISIHISLLGRKKGKEIDHIDGDGLNNQRKNLRWSSHSQNLRNRDIQLNNKSGFTGVSLHKCGKWRACCYLNKKQYHLGLFDDIIKAANAYKKFVKKHYKEFRRSN